MLGLKRPFSSASAMGVRRGIRGAAGPGPGPGLEPETAGYFRRALETLQEGLSPEELALFAPNVLAEAAAAGPGVALDPGGSRVLQALLPQAPLRVLGQILPPLVLGGLGGPAGHPLGARVLEAALGRVLPALGEAVGPAKEEEEEEEEDAVGPVEEAVGGLAAAVRDDPVAFARHPAGSFVVRALLRVLGGAPGAGVPQLPPGGAEPKTKGVELALKGAEPASEGAELPPSFPPLLGQLAEAFEEHLASLLSPAGASLCVQVALEVLNRSQSPACSRLCNALIGQLAPPSPAPAESTLVGGLQDPERSRLLEAAMAVAGPQRLRELFRQHLKGRLRGVAAHRVANHGLQRLLDHAPADVVGEVLSELGPALAEPLARGHPGVLTALLGACRRHPALQQEALRCLFQAFSCWEPRERRKACVGLLAGLRPFGGGDKAAEGAEPEPSLGPVTLHGSLLLQHLLHFGDPAPVLGGLKALPPTALLALACSPPGSRVWDALLASPTVPPRARRRLLRKLKGHFLSLACHRNGSRVLDAVWVSASGPARAAIADELASQHEALQRDPHGRGVARTLALDLFRRRRQLWERLQAAPDRRSLLGPLLED
ncbi:LOW QUALITY PROTEIN: nucleolar protein 9 [Harpia harpyja]|uniref:LOW QUALITY PROTEIN: nucleolar protein 9 n=1 Tax=Harpia harpyja TaxID=202280 RepID=UPI0022B0DD8A|nr:LOW QUALITY PROTEIN: nucleolar protein 9 [Harpia harpyja]